MNETIYEIYKFYLRLTNSKEVSEKDLDKIKKDIGEDVLKARFKDEQDKEGVDISLYLKGKNK